MWRSTHECSNTTIPEQVTADEDMVNALARGALADAAVPAHENSSFRDSAALKELFGHRDNPKKPRRAEKEKDPAPHMPDTALEKAQNRAHDVMSGYKTAK